MTLAPLVNPTVRGVKGAPGILGFWCQAPECVNPAQQRHHIWPKSFLRGQPYEWVKVNGILVQNSCGLCLGHHREVTGEPGRGHQAKLVFNEGLQLLEWWEKDANEEWQYLGVLKGDDGPLVRDVVAEPEKEDLCPSCGKPKAKKKTGPPRKTKSWTVKVPDDTEDGAAHLDAMVDDLSLAMGWGDESKGVRRYHVLTNTLYWVIQMKSEFLAEWEEAYE